MQRREWSYQRKYIAYRCCRDSVPGGTTYLIRTDHIDRPAFATDATGVMRITLRDFRPHVQQLIRADQKELAIRIAQDYLDAYADGLNTYIRDLQRITETSRETRLTKLEQVNG